MKYFCLFFVFFCSTSLTAQNVRLKMPSDFYYSRTPSQNKRIKFTINTKLTAINLITTDNQNSQRLSRNSINRRGNGRPGILIAIPKLFRITELEDGKVYSFGQNAGENETDDATVTIRYQNAPATPVEQPSRPPVIFRVDRSEFHGGRRGRANFRNTEQFLKVEASRNSTATQSEHSNL